MVFVTGGSGMLGAYLMHLLLTRGYAVRALRRRTSNLKYAQMIFDSLSPDGHDLFQKIEWVEGDITDYVSLTEFLKDIDYVYHTAATVSFDTRLKQKILQTNILGTRTIVNAALNAGVKKLCHASSVAALGSEKEGTPITESSERDSSRTSSDYSESKYLSELEVWRCIQEGLNAVIVNPSVIIGAGNWNAGSPSLFSNVYKGFRYYTEGVTGYVDARDVAQVMLLLMESDITAERFLVSSENVSYKQLLFQMADNLSVKPPHIQATPLLTSIAWRLDALRSWMTHTPQKISKSTAKTSFRKQYYSNQKSAQTLQFEYIPIAQSLADVSKIFLNSVLS